MSRPIIVGEDKRVQFFYDVGAAKDMMCVCFPQSQINKIILNAQQHLVDNAISEVRLKLLKLMSSSSDASTNNVDAKSGDLGEKMLDMVKQQTKIESLKRELDTRPQLTSIERSNLMQQIQHLKADLYDRKVEFELGQQLLKSDQTLAQKVSEHMRQMAMFIDKENKVQECLETSHKLKEQVDKLTRELAAKINVVAATSNKTEKQPSKQTIADCQAYETRLQRKQQELDASLTELKQATFARDTTIQQLNETKGLLTAKENEFIASQTQASQYQTQIEAMQQNLDTLAEYVNQLLTKNDAYEQRATQFEADRDALTKREQEAQAAIQKGVESAKKMRQLEIDKQVLQVSVEECEEREKQTAKVEADTKKLNNELTVAKKRLEQSSKQIGVILINISNDCVIKPQQTRLLLCAFMKGYVSFDDIKDVLLSSDDLMDWERDKVRLYESDAKRDTNFKTYVSQYIFPRFKKELE